VAIPICSCAATSPAGKKVTQTCREGFDQAQNLFPKVPLSMFKIEHFEIKFVPVGILISERLEAI